jgi:hypothetical protein
MSGIPDIGTLVRKSATADLRAPVSKDEAEKDRALNRGNYCAA